MALREKLHQIMSEVNYIQKDKKNDFHKYRYASEAAIKEKLHDALVKHGILFQCDPTEFSERTGLGKEGKESLTICKFYYAFQDVETGEKREGTFYASGIDNADKGVYKAITGAIKYILTTTFLIPTGDDPEEEAEPPRETQKQVAERRIAEEQAKVQAQQPAQASGPYTVPTAKQFQAAGKFEALKMFQDIKKHIASLAGSEEPYYTILGAHGVEKSDQFKGSEPALACFKELCAEANALAEKKETAA